MLFQQQDHILKWIEELSWGWSRPTQGQWEQLAKKQKRKHFSIVSAFSESSVCLCYLNSMPSSVSALEQHSGGKKQTGVNNSIPGIQMDVWESRRLHRTLSGVYLKVRRMVKVKCTYEKDGVTTICDCWETQWKFVLWQLQVRFLGSQRREMGMLSEHFGEGCCSLLPRHSIFKWYPSSHSPSALIFFLPAYWGIIGKQKVDVFRLDNMMI